MNGLHSFVSMGECLFRLLLLTVATGQRQGSSFQCRMPLNGLVLPNHGPLLATLHRASVVFSSALSTSQ